MTEIIKDKSLSEKERRLVSYISVVLLTLIIILIFNIFCFSGNTHMTYLESTLLVIKIFNGILSILAFVSCLILYNRSKKESIFIISLMYLGLSVGIVMGYIDYFKFTSGKFVFSNYITISESILRSLLLIVTILPQNKIKSFILSNKIKIISLVIVYSILFGLIEKTLNLNNTKYITFYMFYNIFLMTVYIISSIVLFIKGVKEKEYSFVILSCSIFMLVIKSVYSIYGINIISFDGRLTSVLISCLAFAIVIMGSFIELYMYMCKFRILNDNLQVFYKLVDNNKHNAMFICNKKGEILYANKKMKKMYSKDKELDYNELQFEFDEKGSFVNKKEEIKQAIDDNKVWRGIIKNDNDNITIDCSIQTINLAGEDKEVLITYKDISDELMMEIELEKIKVYDKEKSEFISNISHELRTPLNIFYSTIQLFDETIKNDEVDFRLVYNKYKKTLDLNCKRMLRLINNIIDVSKIDSGIIECKFDNYNIVAIVEDITLSVVRYALLKGINIQFDTEEEECFIKCDSAMIERVILNILSNAIKFSSENKDIYVNIFVNRDYVEINVKDQGIGISKDAQQIVFEKFVQNDKSFNRMNEGSGIGLSLVQSIVDLHHGRVEIDSKLDEGTNFKIFLPNKYLKGQEFKIYDIDNHNIELELSDIYEVLA